VSEHPADLDIRADLSARLDLAVAVAAEAGELILRHYDDRDLVVETKRDDTPVTIADREAEQLIRARVEAKYPDHAVLGEEYGESNAGARVRWILAEKSFARFNGLFGSAVFVIGVCQFQLNLRREFAKRKTRL